MTQISTIQIEIRFLDPAPEARRWNGGAFPSARARELREPIVRAAEDTIRQAGFTLVGCGSGVTAKEYE